MAPRFPCYLRCIDWGCMASTPPLVYGILGEGGKSLTSYGAAESVAKSHRGEGEKISRLWLPKGHLLPGRSQPAWHYLMFRPKQKRICLRR
ncbi:hypothetical protein VNO77_14597 [Canavalia gladiata]|uniref:Uncharacterized protein n=1 Tax=Canavalia gladiata TaxID=3824 RepID=A0AAN9M2X7_CANGL